MKCWCCDDFGIRKCFCDEHTRHMFSVLSTPSISNTLRPQRSERHLHSVPSKQIGIHGYYWWRSSCHCRTGAPLSIERPQQFEEWRIWSTLFKHLKYFVRAHPTWSGNVMGRLICIILDLINSWLISWFDHLMFSVDGVKEAAGMKIRFNI